MIGIEFPKCLPKRVTWNPCIALNSQDPYQGPSQPSAEHSHCPRGKQPPKQKFLVELPSVCTLRKTSQEEHNCVVTNETAHTTEFPTREGGRETNNHPKRGGKFLLLKASTHGLITTERC